MDIDFDDKPATVENASEVIPEVRRGRGRPRKNTDGENKETPNEKTPTNTVKPKRRKRGPVSETEITERAKAIAAAHFTLAFLTKTPEMIINEQEAIALAQANLNLENEFDFTLDGKTIAVISMIGAAFGVYSKRIPAIISRVQETKKRKEAEKAMGVNSDGQQ